jgi:hypothetical protein
MTLVMVAGALACTERGEDYDNGMGGSPPAVNEDTRRDTTVFPADTMITRDTMLRDTLEPFRDTSRVP